MCILRHTETYAHVQYTHTCVHTCIHTGFEHTHKIHAAPAIYYCLGNYPKLGGTKQRPFVPMHSVGMACRGSAMTTATGGKNQMAGGIFTHMSGTWPEMTAMAPRASLSLLKSQGLSMWSLYVASLAWGPGSSWLLKGQLRTPRGMVLMSKVDAARPFMTSPWKSHSVTFVTFI